MKNRVQSWVDAVQLEKDILRFWEETGAFERLRKKNEGNQTWSFLDGPITANNPMGVHHAWGRTLKDAFQRYWAMNGRDLRYQNGFDCQGLWVEVEVEKELGVQSKKEIEKYGIDKFVDKCKARVDKYSEIISQQSIRLGYWMDWNDSYFTMSDENNYTIWGFLKKCHQRGKIYRGTDVMPWSGRSGTGYSQMEVVEGRKLVVHEAVFLKFPLRGRPKENLLVWTTTPWTLTSNVGAMINGELEYVKIRSKADGEVYYFAAENLRYERLKRQYDEKKEWVDGVPRLKPLHDVFEEAGGYEIEAHLKGSEMVGWEYDGPFDELEAQQIVGGYPWTDPRVKGSGVTSHRVIDGGRDSQGNPIVVVGEGTGIVHAAPGCGDIDHIVGEQLGLPHIAPLDAEAKFLDKFGELEGKHALAPDTVKYILGSLKEKGLLVHVERYPHVYPHCWRSGDPLVFRLVDEWYINMDWRDEIKDIVKKIKWIPAWGEERELEWLDNMRDWMISKKRYWGLALPIWVCDNCDWYDVIGGKEELKERAIEGWEDFDGHSPHRPWIDNIKITCTECGGTASRIPDVGNPWLDAGIVSYSTVKYNSDRDYWKKWIPADLVLECFPGQFRNWFYSLLAMSTMMENIPPFKSLVGHALARDENGNEMHKSSGNAIWFDDAVEEIGADVMRWIYCRQEPTSNLNFGYGLGREVRGKFYNTLWNTFSFFLNYAELDGFVPPRDPSRIESRPKFDRWIISKKNLLVERARGAFEKYDTRSVVLEVEDFVEELSNWYIRQNRRRFWKTDDSEDKQMAYETLHECLYALFRVIAPIMPFITEEMYQRLVRAHDEGAPSTVHCTDYPSTENAFIDRELTEVMSATKRLSSMALKARENARIKVRQPLAKLVICPGDDAESKAVHEFEALLKEELNVKELEQVNAGTAPPDVPVQTIVKPNLKILGKRLKKKLGPFKKVFADISEQLAEHYAAGDSSFAVDLGDEVIQISRDDLLAKEIASKDVAIASEAETWVSFDTDITEDLRIEGLMREMLRSLQVLRKEVGLEIEDRIHLTFSTSSEDLSTVFERFDEHIKSELLALEINRGEVADGKQLKIAGQQLHVEITTPS